MNEANQQLQAVTQDRGISNVVTPMTMLQAARESGASLEQMQQLMEMHERWEANEARKAFYRAKAAFKAEPITITKDKENKHFNSWYTGIGNLVNTVNMALSKHELSASWDVTQSGKVITVACVLSHAMGHSERVSISGEPDTSGSKNAIQAIKSTVTYLKIATYEMITGVASTDDPSDDDGNGAGDQPAGEQQNKTQGQSGPPAYSSEEFDKNYPAWEQLIESGKKSADYVITQLETKVKLSEAQKKKLRDVKVIKGVEK